MGIVATCLASELWEAAVEYKRAAGSLEGRCHCRAKRSSSLRLMQFEPLVEFLGFHQQGGNVERQKQLHWLSFKSWHPAFLSPRSPFLPFFRPSFYSSNSFMLHFFHFSSLHLLLPSFFNHLSIHRSFQPKTLQFPSFICLVHPFFFFWTLVSIFFLSFITPFAVFSFFHSPSLVLNLFILLSWPLNRHSLLYPLFISPHSCFLSSSFFLLLSLHPNPPTLVPLRSSTVLL